MINLLWVGRGAGVQTIKKTPHDGNFLRRHIRMSADRHRRAAWTGHPQTDTRNVTWVPRAMGAALSGPSGALHPTRKGAH
jgi:hypothetical protein